MRVYTNAFKGPQVESDLTDAVNAKLMENIYGDYDSTAAQLSNLRSYMTNLVVKLAEKGVLNAVDLEDGLVGYQFKVEDDK